jgi:hypothetical protein
VDVLWKRRWSALADTAQPAPQRLIQACLDRLLLRGRICPALLLRRFGVPQINVKALDLLDQQEDRLAGCAKIVAAVGNKTRAPRTELVDLPFVQAFAQRYPAFKQPVYAEPG